MAELKPMREILFRGKRIDNGEWIKGCLLKVTLGRKTVYFIFGDNFTFNGTDVKALNRALVAPETVGQYTRLTDKNGKKIFEGDILEHHAQGDILINRGIVNWDAKNARWAHQLNTMNPCFTFFKADAYEVIGNIHDNPELLGG